MRLMSFSSFNNGPKKQKNLTILTEIMIINNDLLFFEKLTNSFQVKHVKFFKKEFLNFQKIAFRQLNNQWWARYFLKVLRYRYSVPFQNSTAVPVRCQKSTAVPVLGTFE